MSSLSVNSSNVACPVAMISLAGVAVVLRIVVRLKRLAIEDLLVVISLVFSAMSTGFLIKQSTGFFDPDSIIFMKPADVISMYENFSKSGYLSSLFYFLSFGFIQVAFLLSCLRWLSVSPPVEVEGKTPMPRPRSRAVKVILGLIVIYNIWLFGMEMAKCIPLDAVWNPLTYSSSCLPQAVWWAANFLHILVNFLVLLLGIAVSVRAWVREMLATTKKRTATKTDQKIGLAFVFVLGFFVCIISILRVIRSPGDPSNNPKPAASNFEPAFTSTWEVTDLWTVIELNVAIICAALTALNPLWTAFTNKLLGDRMGSRGGIAESDGGSMTKIGELDGIARGELESGDSHGELEALGQRQELDGVARQHPGELDGTVVAELDGDTTYTFQGQETVLQGKPEASMLPTGRN